MDKREKEKQRQQEDQALNKLLCWVCGAAVLIVILMLAKRYRVNFTVDELELAQGVFYASRVAAILGLVLAVAMGGLYWYRIRAGKKDAWPAGLAVFFLGLAVGSFAVWHDSSSSTRTDFVIVLIIATAVLALVYYLYQRDFFVIAVALVVGFLGVWLISRLGRSKWTYLFTALAWVLFVAAVVGAQMLRKNKGTLKVKDREVRLLPVKANYVLILVSAGLMGILLIAALALAGAGIPATVFYAVPVAWGLIMAVYYTVKLM